MLKKRPLKKFAAIFFAFIILSTGFAGLNSQPAYALDNGLAKTPPMGWNSWNHFGCNVSAELIKETAKAMVESGMKEAGYEYVNIDDCWMLDHRDENGNLVPDPERFPNGIKAVADYVHSLGLKIGIYESAGTTTCQGFPGSINHEMQDARTFAKWGIDYLKYDNCGDHLGQSFIERYTAMRDALAATGRDIVFSMCQWGVNEPWKWAKPIANLWRTTGDIRDSWSSVMSILDQQVGLAQYAGPGHWNDPDMLEVGNGGMTPTEYRAHFSLWSLLAAPLLAGNDLRNMSETTLDILTNEEVIAVDQDVMGLQGHKIRDNGDLEVWMRPLANGDRAVILLNRSEQETEMSVNVKELGIPAPAEGDTYAVRDLWEHETATTTGVISASVPSHGAAMYRVSPGTEENRSSDDFHRVSKNGAQEVWVKSLSDGSKFVTLANRGVEPTTVSISAEKLGLPYASAYVIENNWSRNKTAAASKISAAVPPLNAVSFRVTPGMPDQAAPATVLSIESEASYLAPGETNEITTTLTNNGRIAIEDVKVDLRVPEGWEVEPASKTFDNVPPESPGQTKTVTWEVMVPENISSDHAVISVQASFTYGDEGKTATNQAWTTVNLPPVPPKSDAYLSDMSFFGNPVNGWGPIERDMSNGETGQGDGSTITLNGVTYEKGLGVHAYSEVSFYLGGGFSTFVSDIGLDDEENGTSGQVTFQVWGDGEKLYDSGIMKEDSATKHVNVDINGVDKLTLIVTNGGNGKNYDHADWAGARILK